MDETIRVQGREITKDDIELVRRLIEANPSQNRTQLLKELCLLWNWRAGNGQLKDMACRSLLLKLEQQGHITLPNPQEFIGWNAKIRKSNLKFLTNNMRFLVLPWLR